MIWGSPDFQNVYLIPHKRSRYIVYLPIHGIIFNGNASAVNLLYNALNGDIKAQSRLGLNPGQIDKIRRTESKPQTEKKESILPHSCYSFSYIQLFTQMQILLCKCRRI